MLGLFGMYVSMIWLGSGRADAAELRVKGLPLSLTVPDARWQWDTSQERVLELWSPTRGVPRFHVEHLQTAQPDPETADLEAFEDLLKHRFEATGHLDQTHAELHPVDGLGMTLLASGRQQTSGSKLDLRVVVVPDAGGLVAMYGFDLAGSPGLTRRTDELLSSLHLDHPPLSHDQLGYGHVTQVVGYELDLPERWRMLSPDESPNDAVELVEGGAHALQAAQATYVDTATLLSDAELARAFVCRAKSTAVAPLQIVNPRHDPIPAGNLLARLGVLIGGGTLQQGNDWLDQALAWRFRTDDIVVKLAPSDPQDVHIETLADRDAFRWQGRGTRMGEPVTVGAWYTSWDDVELYCVAVIPQHDDEALAAFDQAMHTLRVTDAEHHPMYVSFRTRYVNWWPWSHPLVQIYLLPVYVFVPLFGLLLWWSRGSSPRSSRR